MKQLWHNGTIYTMEREDETVESVLVEAGDIIDTGTFERLSTQADEYVDLEGAVMYPGFVDSHLHMLYEGETFVRLDLSAASSAEEMLELVREAASNTPEDQWLFGEGWNENSFVDPRIPTMEELDAIRREPIFLTRVCHHAAVGNTAALAAGGIDAGRIPPAGGEIGLDEKGALNGLLYDKAMELVTDAIPKKGEAYVDYLTGILERAVDEMLSYGLTGGHTEDLHYFGVYTNPLTAFKRVIGEKRPFRVNLLRHHEVFEDMMKAEIVYDEPFIEPGAMKIFADGALGGSTAALNEPYADQPENNGLLIHTDEEMAALVKLARRYGEAVAVHIIGDRAAEQVLTAIEQHPAPAGKRDRLIHACVLNDSLLDRLAKLPVVLDIQPAFVPSDFPWVIDRLGQGRISSAYQWKTLLQKGIMCAAGTDAPIESLNPLDTIYAAVERKKPGTQQEGWGEDQRLSRFEAVRLYTYGSAQAIGKEQERGFIKSGYAADFSIFDRDLFKGTSEEMRTAQAVKTVVAGRVVFKREES